MYEEHTEVILDEQGWSTVNKTAVFHSIREFIGVCASKLLPAMQEWVMRRKVRDIPTEEHAAVLHGKQYEAYFPNENEELETRFLIFSDDLDAEQVGFFGKISKAKYEKEWPQFTGYCFFSFMTALGNNPRRRIYSKTSIYTTFYGLGFGIPPTLVSALSSQVGNDYCTLLPLEGTLV
jgi:hypothetical protein